MPERLVPLQEMSRILHLVFEARRRGVFRVAGIYIVAAWVTIQVISEVFEAFAIPDTAMQFVFLAALFGFPLALVFGWLYDVSANGIVRTAPALPDADVDLNLRGIDYVIFAALAIVAAGIVFQLTSSIDTGNELSIDTESLSIAVLPLDNLSGDPDQAYFVAGMHDALISALSRISGLRVTSRTSTLPFSAEPKPIREIASELGVSTVIEGSVYRVDNRVRIIVQLIDAIDDVHIWENSYEQELTDVLRMQSDIARAIADEVEVQLTNEESLSFAATGSVDPAAYETYLQGKFYAEQFTPEDMRQAYDLYQRAVELDPDSALAWTGLARICRFQLQAGLMRPRDGEPRCREPLITALQLDDTLADVHLGLASSYWLYDYNWDAADASFRRAIELNPSHAEARMFYSHFLANIARLEDSNEQMLLARQLDPLNIFVQALHAAQMHLVGDLEEGVSKLQIIVDEWPSLGFGYDVLWGGHVRLGNFDLALDAARNHFGLTMGQPSMVEAIDRGFAAGGFRRAMLEGAQEAVRLNMEGYIPAVEISMLFELSGDLDGMFEWLDTAYEQHDPTLPYSGAAALFNHDPDEPRFIALLERMNLGGWVEIYANESSSQASPN